METDEQNIKQQHSNRKIFNWILSDLLTSFPCENRLANCFILCVNFRAKIKTREKKKKRVAHNKSDYKISAEQTKVCFNGIAGRFLYCSACIWAFFYFCFVFG